MTLTATVIIPTYHRPHELEVCLKSLLRQTLLPTEIIVVDDGHLPGPPLSAEIEKAGIAYLYLKKDKPGLTESRNAGVAAASGEIIFFLDDDVELYPEYLEKILEVYENDAREEIAGVGGKIANAKPMTFLRTLRWLVNVLFLNSGFREGKILPSGFCVDDGATPFRSNATRDVDFLSGGASSFRSWVFNDMSFTDGYRSVALGEDKDFTGRLSRRHRLVFVPAARLNHYEAPKMRPAKREWGRKIILGRYLFLKAVVGPKWWRWVCFYYALAGYLLIRLGIALVRCDASEYGHVAGIVEALGLIVRRRVPSQE